MEAISKIAGRSELIQQQHEDRPRGLLSLRQPNAVMGPQLVYLMAQAQAFKPNQTLPPGTADTWLPAWEEIAEEVGMEQFTRGLWKALRSSPFFPAPEVLEEVCRTTVREEKRIAREAKEKSDWDEHVAQCIAERAQDGLQPLVGVKPIDIAELTAAVNAKRTAPPVTHDVTAMPLEHGWFRQTCTCGREWDTAGSVPTCGAGNWKQHKLEVETGLAELQSRRTKEPA